MTDYPDGGSFSGTPDKNNDGPFNVGPGRPYPSCIPTWAKGHNYIQILDDRSRSEWLETTGRTFKDLPLNSDYDVNIFAELKSQL